MRVAATLALVLLAGCGGGDAATRPAAPTLPAAGHLVEPGSSVPFVVADRLRGQVAVLDFWASWCDDCRRTIPQVARLYTAYAREGLVVVGVNAGETVDVAQRSAADLGITYPVVLDPELAFSDSVGATALPTLLVIDRDGRIAHRAKHVDADTLEVVRSLLHAAPH